MFFRPGRFGGSTEMNQQQAPMATPSAGVPMSVFDSAPPPQRRSENAQLSSATPIQEDRPMQPMAVGGPPAPDNPNRPNGAGDRQAVNGPTPPTATPPDNVTPAPPMPSRYGPTGGKAPSLAEQMQAKAMSGQLTIQDALQARQMGEDGIAVAILQALAGNGWNYTPRGATPPAAQQPITPGMNANNIYDRPGAGPGVGGSLESTMAQKAQTGQLTAADALAAEQAGNTALATSIRNSVAGLGWQYPPGNFQSQPGTRVDESQPGGGGRRYTTRIPGASKGIYTG